MLREGPPGLDGAGALELMHLIAVISEGTSAIYGTRANRKVPLERLVRVVSEMVAQALDARVSASKRETRRASSA